MCTITKELETPIKASGYKFVIKKDNRYFSPCTGLEYTVGMTLPKMTEFIKENADNGWDSDILRKGSAFYEERMQGNTGIIRTLDGLLSANFYLDSTFLYAVIKITLDNTLYKGEFLGVKTLIGNGISNIEEIGIVEPNSGYLNSNTLILTNQD